MTPASRLIVAADFEPAIEPLADPRNAVAFVRDKVLALASLLKNTGAVIKVNSALRAAGYSLIDELHGLGLQVMADLKFTDIGQTNGIDGRLLAAYRPEIVTVMCNAGVKGMRRLVEPLREAGTTVLGVTVLTSLSADDCTAIYGCPTRGAVVRLARLAKEADLHGLILGGPLLAIVRAEPSLEGLELDTPGIRPAFAAVEGDDQKQVMTPAQALAAGAKRIVVGRPITKAKDPLQALQLTLAEMSQALEPEGRLS